ncbi:hypothetical protein B0A49_07623 [Cryomyces minteri]|uniref:Uncharacterized protein n=1 Tax=Cryomyces minteri TaxID=331657 RepID=A0A4U0WV60_9PEZI|nr:hypothetical protein B0A49_07623 [Cryomyces minteri]
MARLRRDEEALAYTRMLTPAAPYPTSTLTQRHPITPNAHLTPLPLSSADDDDETTYADINRQTTLILNVLVSILACAVAIWVAARHWPVPARLALSMGGSALVAVADVVVYGGYIRRVGEAKGAEMERERREVREVVETWSIGGGGGGKKKLLEGEGDGARSRRGKHR